MSGFMVALNGETTFPAVHAELEAQMLKYFCASFASTGKFDCWLFHHTSGFSFKSSLCPDRYPSISFVIICPWCSSTLTGEACPSSCALILDSWSLNKVPRLHFFGFGVDG